MNQNEQRRRSSRIRNQSTAVPPRSSSDSSFSSSSAPQPRQPQPQLRKKNKRAFQDVTNTVARKRPSASSSSSSVDSARSFKKGRMTFKSPSQASTTAKNTVTPMMTKSSTASGDALPIASRFRSVPEGVLNLYPETRRYSCTCDENHCSSQSLSHCFLTQYGKEYSDSLKDWNALYFPASSKATADKCDDHSSCSSDSTHTYDSSMPTAPSGGVQYVVHGSINDEESEISTMSQQIEYQPHLTEKMRAVLVDWLIELSVEYKLHPRTLHLTVALLDRALECGKNGDLIIEREMFQCLGCTLMWMSSKMEEITPPTVDDFVYISADSYSKKEITEMEVSVCDALQFRLWQVTSFDFVEEFLRASNTRRAANCPIVAASSSLERSMVHYLLELSLIPNDLSSQPPRKICAAAVYLSRVVLGIGANEWSATLQHYTGYTKWDLEDLVLQLYKYHAASEESKLVNAFAKYSKEKYHQVAFKTVPLEQDLGF